MIVNSHAWARTLSILTGRGGGTKTADMPAYIHAPQEDPMRLLSRIASGEAEPPVLNPHRGR